MQKRKVRKGVRRVKTRPVGGLLKVRNRSLAKMFVTPSFQLPEHHCRHCRHRGLAMAEEPESGPSSRRRLLLGAPVALAAARYATVDSFPLSWEGPIRTFDAFVNMTGRTVLITGATTGIGYETAARLAEEGATLVLAGRSQERMQAAARRIVARAKRAGVEQPQVETASLDLASLASVRAFAAAFTRSHAQLDVLLLNAGVSSLPQRTLTEDGLEMQFQARARPTHAHRHPLSLSLHRSLPPSLAFSPLRSPAGELSRALPADEPADAAAARRARAARRERRLCRELPAHREDTARRPAACQPPLLRQALHPAPRTLHPAPCTLHPTSCTLHPAPCTLNPAPHAPRPAPHAPRSCTTPVDCFAYHQSELPGGKSCHSPHMTTATAHT